jgi:hypothetical protein
MRLALLLCVEGTLVLMASLATACPPGTHEETQTDECGKKENHPTCVHWDVNNKCDQVKDNWECVRTSKTTCENDARK